MLLMKKNVIEYWIIVQINRYIELNCPLFWGILTLDLQVLEVLLSSIYIAFVGSLTIVKGPSPL